MMRRRSSRMYAHGLPPPALVKCRSCVRSPTASMRSSSHRSLSLSVVSGSEAGRAQASARYAAWHSK